MASGYHIGQSTQSTLPSSQKLPLYSTGLRENRLLCSFLFTQYVPRAFLVVVWHPQEAWPIKISTLNGMEHNSHWLNSAMQIHHLQVLLCGSGVPSSITQPVSNRTHFTQMKARFLEWRKTMHYDMDLKNLSIREAQAIPLGLRCCGF
jgi:hypothetical protein